MRFNNTDTRNIKHCTEHTVNQIKGKEDNTGENLEGGVTKEKTNKGNYRRKTANRSMNDDKLTNSRNVACLKQSTALSSD